MIIIQDKKFWMKLFLACLFLLVVAPVFVNSAQPQVFTGESGLEIKVPQVEYLKQNRDVEFNFHVFNKSNGMPLDETDVSCSVHLYNQTGSHIYTENITTTIYLWDFTGDISGGNFSVLGIYSFIFQCNNSNYGGFVSSAVEVTYNGNAPPSDLVKVFFIISFIAILILMIITIFLLVKHMEKYDVGFMDVIYMFSIYLAVFSLKYFNMEYMGSYLIDTFSDLFITVGAFTHIIIPIIIFIVCFMKRRLELKEEEF